GRADTIGVQGHRAVQEGEGGRGHWEPPVRRPAVWFACAAVGALLQPCRQLVRRVSVAGCVAAGEVQQPGVAAPPLGVASPLRRL
ncbi:unnamed protein product, partial [Urochloa humidicola]